MAIAALALYIVWFLTAFGLRTIVQLHRTGDSGFRGISRSGGLEVAAGVGFVVALVVGFAAPVAELLGLGRIALLDRPVIAALGAVFAVGGGLLTLTAQMSMGESWRIGVDASERTTLVDAGAFRLVRNPVFSAMILTALGLTLMVPNWLAILGLASLIIATQAQVRAVEEPYLCSVHGDAYHHYESEVGRFVPRLIEWRRPDGSMNLLGRGTCRHKPPHQNVAEYRGDP